jgi:hypothetical protein
LVEEVEAMTKGKMLWIMLAGCAAVVAGVFLLPLVGIRLGTSLSTLLVLLCPLSHIVMMAFMGHGHQEHGHGRKTESLEKPVAEPIEYQPRPLLPAPTERR